MSHQAHYRIDVASLDSTTRPEGNGGGRYSFLIVDDHALVRYGLSLAIRQRYADAVIVEAGSLAEGLDKLRSLSHVTAVLYDLHMEEEDELEGLSTMLEAAGDVPLIVVSGAGDNRTIANCIRAGARGFVSKGCEGVVLDQALPIVLGGGIYAPAPPPMVTASLTAKGSAPHARQAVQKVGGPVEALTDRQREVLALLLEGQSNKEIARALGVLEGTVKVHLRAIMMRLGARNRTQLALAAVKAGVLAP